MNWAVLFTIYLIILFALFLLGQKIAFCLGLTGIVGLIILDNPQAMQGFGLTVWNCVNSFELTAVPMFIFMGEIVGICGLSDNFYKSASTWFGRVTGGFLQTNIFSCAVFAAISGSSLATAAAIGSVSYPELKNRGYNKEMILGTLGGGGALGIMIPPSIPLLIYGSLTQESVTKLFMAGVIPGVLAAVLFAIYTYIRCKISPSLAPEKGARASLREKLASFRGMLPFFILILIIMGGIYLGYTTATEAAGISVIVALLLSLLYRTITWQKFITAVVNTVKSSCMIFFIVVGAQMLSYLIVRSDISRDLTQFVINLHPSKTSFFLMICLVYLVLGCLMDGTSIVYLTIPILFPLLQAMQIDTLWFGVVLVALIEIAMLTPPVGMNLFVLHGITKDGTSLGTIIRGCAPYILLYAFVIVLLIFFPGLATWLPSTM